MNKSTFFDFLNRNTNHNLESFLAKSREDVDYINWHDYCLPMTYGDDASEYRAVRSTCALFDASPIKKYKISGADAGAFLDAVMTRQMSTQRSMRVGYTLFCNEDGMLQVGTLPSVAWSHGLNCWLGIASIKTDFFRDDLEYHVQIGGAQIACRPKKLPFVKFDRYRQVPAPV